ncbi:MAG TPA: type II toxin-antitoxin system VapC family toxin [Ktedonobacterales bacterium]
MKRYHHEAGSPWVRSICDPRTHPSLYLAQLAHVEVIAALYRTARRENLHLSFSNSLVSIFERHLAMSDPTRRSPVYRIVPLSTTVTDLAAFLCKRYWDMSPRPIRSLDAIQLAAAMLAARASGEEVLFVTADTRLAEIAVLEGFTVVNPVSPP